MSYNEHKYCYMNEWTLLVGCIEHLYDLDFVRMCHTLSQDGVC
jgi:hypothetical protein